MKLLLFFAGFLIFQSNINSQMRSWEIKINNTKILESSKEDLEENCRKINKSIWKKNGTLEISFSDQSPMSLKHTLIFQDESGNQLFQLEDTTKASLTFDKLKSFYKEKKVIMIYIEIAPRNTEIMMPTRNMHLCTIMLP